VFHYEALICDILFNHQKNKPCFVRATNHYVSDQVLFLCTGVNYSLKSGTGHILSLLKVIIQNLCEKKQYSLA